MNTFLRIIALLGLPSPRITLAGNEDVIAANDVMVGGSFSVLQTDGFEIPYGTYPHSVGMQMFDRESATLMANEMSSLLGKLMTGFRGIPVYVGHPDHPDKTISTQFTDRRARGWVKEIIPGDTSARLIVAYNELGKQEIQDAQWGGYSPMWFMQPVGRGGMRPVRLKSIGLTNNPNMPVPPLIAANEGEVKEPAEPAPAVSREPPASTNPDHPMKPELKAKLLKLIGLTAEASDEDFDTAANEYCDKAIAEKDKTKPKEGEEESKEGESTAIAAMREKVDGAVTAANEATENMRVTRIDFALDQLVTSGRLPLSQVSTMRDKLVLVANEADLTQEINALRAAKPSLQTRQSLTPHLAKHRNLTLAANEKDGRKNLRDQAFREARTEIAKGRTPRPEDDGAAWDLARSLHPELF